MRDQVKVMNWSIVNEREFRMNLCNRPIIVRELFIR